MSSLTPVAPRSTSAKTRVLAVVGLVLFIAATFPLFWYFPGNDDHGEGPGHALAHLTWSVAIVCLAVWLWRQRASFVGGRGPVIAVIGLFLAAAAQACESVGATIVWATGKHADGDFAVHDAVAAGGNTLAAVVVLSGLLVWGVTATVRRVRTAS